MILNEHRIILSKNPNSYIYDVLNNEGRLCKSLIPHLKNAGYQYVTYGKCKDILNKIIILLFSAQDERPVLRPGRNARDQGVMWTREFY